MMKTTTSAPPSMIQNNEDCGDEIIAKLKEAKNQFFSEYNKAEETFQPYLLGSFLYKVYTSLKAFNGNPKHLSALFQSINLIQDDITPQLTKEHQPLLAKIKQQKEHNVLHLMTKLLDDKIAYDELSESIADIENLLTLTTPHSEELKNGWNRLHSHFQQRTLRREQDEKAAALTIEAEHCMDDINKNPWQPLTEKKQKHFELLKCLQTLFPLLRHNHPVSIDHKEQYIGMLRAGFELTGDPKFIDTLSSSIDLFYPKNSEIPQALMDYISNSQKQFNTNNSDQNPKKRSQFEGKNNIAGQPSPKRLKPILKVRFADNLPSEQNEVSTNIRTHAEHAFIHLLNPLLTNSIDLNPMFAAQILTSLADVSWIMNHHGVHGGPLLTINYDLLNYAKDFCEQIKSPDEKLLNCIIHRIDSLKSSSKQAQRLFHDYSKFKPTEKKFEDNKLQTHTKSFKDQFQQILTDFIDELGGHIANATQKDQVIWQLRMELLNDLAKNNMKDDLVKQLRTALQIDLANNKTQDHFIKSMQQTLNDIENQHKVASASHSEKQPPSSVTSMPHTTKASAFSSLTIALRYGTPEEFQAYISAKKAEYADKNRFYRFLTALNKDGYTALHNAYDCHFDTFSLYIQELKNTMKDIKKIDNFKTYLTYKNPHGGNFFHQLANKSNNFDYIKKATQLMRQELGDDLYVRELRRKNKYSRTPHKSTKNQLATQVNDYIAREIRRASSPNENVSLTQNSIFNQQKNNKTNAPVVSTMIPMTQLMGTTLRVQRVNDEDIGRAPRYCAQKTQTWGFEHRSNEHNDTVDPHSIFR